MLKLSNTHTYTRTFGTLKSVKTSRSNVPLRISNFKGLEVRSVVQYAPHYMAHWFCCFVSFIRRLGVHTDCFSACPSSALDTEMTWGPRAPRSCLWLVPWLEFLLIDCLPLFSGYSEMFYLVNWQSLWKSVQFTLKSWLRGQRNTLWLEELRDNSCVSEVKKWFKTFPRTILGNGSRFKSIDLIPLLGGNYRHLVKGWAHYNC